MNDSNITGFLTDQTGIICPSLDGLYLNLTLEAKADVFIETHGYSLTDIVVHTIVLPFILSAGLLGNVAFLIVVSQIRWMRTITNCYLVNLALADVTFLIASVGEKLHQYSFTPFVYDDLPKGPAGCVLVPFTKDFCFYSSISLVTCISLERFNAACHPLKHRRNKGAKLRARTAKLTAGAWVLSLVAASLRISASCCDFRVYCLLWPDTEPYKDYPGFIGECRPPEEWIAYLTKCIQFVLFTLAMGVNTVLYGRITRAVHCATARPNARQVPSGGHSTIEAKITRMVVATGVIFFLCLAPYELFSSLLMIIPGNGNIVSAMQVFRMLLYLNSAINPFIYNVANPRYRRAFRLVFTCKVIWRTRRLSQSTRRRPSRNGNINQTRPENKT